MKKNFIQSADYLLDHYYPNTQIDTEIIVRSVANDVKRQQNYVLYRLLKSRADKQRKDDASVAAFPPVVVPMVYQAQSAHDLHFLVRMQESFNELDCSVTYDR